MDYNPIDEVYQIALGPGNEGKVIDLTIDYMYISQSHTAYYECYYDQLAFLNGPWYAPSYSLAPAACGGYWDVGQSRNLFRNSA